MKKIICIITLMALITGCSSSKNTGNKTEENNNVKVVIKENSAKEEQQEGVAAIRDLFQKKYEEEEFNGSLLIIENGEEKISESFGYADVKNKMKFDKDTKFEIGTLTEQFTAIGILKLEEDGKLALEDTVDKYIDGFPKGNEVTIHQLLANTSGLDSFPGPGDMKAFKPSHKDEKLIKPEIEYVGYKGKTYKASVTGYVILGYIIESVTGEECSEYIEENVIKAAGLSNTVYKKKDQKVSSLAVGYYDKKLEAVKENPLEKHIGYSTGSYGICSTLDDLNKWNSALFDGKIISLEQLEKMTTQHIKSYGYSCQVKKSYDNIVVSDLGATYGQYGYVIYNPYEKSSVIFWANISGTNIIEEIDYIIRKEMFTYY